MLPSRTVAILDKCTNCTYITHNYFDSINRIMGSEMLPPYFVSPHNQEGIMSAQPVDIQILGRTLRVNCPKEQQDALKSSAAELEQRLKDLKNRTGVTNTEQLIFIVALNICHELAQEKIKTQDYTDNMEQKIRVLQHTIEQALQEQARITGRTITPLE